MILLNFAHPLTLLQRDAIEHLAGQPLEEVREIATQFDAAQPFREQAQTLLASVGLSAEEWQTRALLLNLPGLNVIAALLLAELHGRCGYFPAVLRLRSVPNATPPRFEVAEILNLQHIRDNARLTR